MPKPFIFAFVLSVASGCAGDNHARPLLWEVAGDTNKVYLLGSVHLLRAEDYPLPLAFDEAYREAEHLVMELDMDDLDAAEIRKTMLDAGLISDGSDLQALLGDTIWSTAEAEAAAIDIELENLSFAEPWLAALTIVDMQMIRMGYDPRHGVEVYFTGLAQRDGKPVSGLESVSQQIAFFDALPLATQSRFLLKAIEDAKDLEPGMDRLLSAWRNGDTAALEQEMLAGFDEFPELYESLVVRRNRRWAQELQKLFDGDVDYLVIVGALHLIGDDSVLVQLRDAGYDVKRH